MALLARLQTIISEPIALFGREGPVNTTQDLAVASLITVTVILVIWLLKRLAVHRLRSREQQARVTERLVLQVLGRTRLFAGSVIALYAGSLALELPHLLERVLPLAAIAAFLIQLGLWASRAISLSADSLYKKKREEGDGASAGAITLIAIGARAIVWLLVALLLLANFGVNITALVAGLGVGGIAVALALQKVLSDIFASISIMLDKPFKVGEFIIVDDYLGTVEQIGVKTTRLKALSGEHLVFSNNDLLDSRIRNYSRMTERRAVLNVGIAYETSIDKLKSVNEILRAEIEATELVRADRIHLKAFGDFAFIYEAIFYVEVPDMATFMDLQQSILFRVLERLRAEDVEIAYPTQTIHLHGSAPAGAPPARDR
jgi:small-conductance mechanosensitive channel